MAHWVFLNNTNVPVNIGIYNGGFLYFYKNHVQPYGVGSCKEVDPAELPPFPWTKDLPHTASGKLLLPDTCLAAFDVSGAGYDVLVVYDSASTELDPATTNWAWGANVATLVAGSFVTAIGAVLTFATWGAAAEIVVAGIALTGSAVTAISAVSTGVGIALTIASGATAIVQAALAPATFRNWAGAKPYTFGINGGFDFQVESDGKAVITGAEKISIHWNDTSSGASGVIQS